MLTDIQYYIAKDSIIIDVEYKEDCCFNALAWEKKLMLKVSHTFYFKFIFIV